MTVRNQIHAITIRVLQLRNLCDVAGDAEFADTAGRRILQRLAGRIDFQHRITDRVT